jgi:hypothetical protein
MKILLGYFLDLAALIFTGLCGVAFLMVPPMVFTHYAIVSRSGFLFALAIPFFLLWIGAWIGAFTWWSETDDGKKLRAKIGKVFE